MTRTKSRQRRKIPMDPNFIITIISLVALCIVTGALSVITKEPVFSQAFLLLIGSIGGLATGKRMSQA